MDDYRRGHFPMGEQLSHSNSGRRSAAAAAGPSRRVEHREMAKQPSKKGTKLQQVNFHLLKDGVTDLKSAIADGKSECSFQWPVVL